MLIPPPAFRRLLPLLLLALAPPLLAGSIDLRAPDDISELLQAYLPDEAGSPHKLQGLISEILSTEGYFSPLFEFSEVDGRLQINLDPGPRTTITQVDIAIAGPVDAADRNALVAGWRLPNGHPFRQDDWNTAKQSVLAELLAVDHAAAKLVDSAAEIDTASHSASLNVHYDAGPRYRFGAMRIEGLTRYTPELIERYNNSVQTGAPYREDRLAALQSALQATPYFSSVLAGIDMDTPPGEDGTVTAPVLLRVRETAPHRVAFGIGASSNTGARVEVSYHTPDVFNQAWELDSGLQVEQKKQTAYADIFLPPDQRNRRNSVGTMVEASDIAGLRTERYAIGAQTVQQRGKAEQRLSLNWEEERRSTDTVAPSNSRALVPNGLWTLRRVDSVLNPRHGIVLQGEVGGGAKAALSDQNFIRLHARYQQFIPLGKLDTLTLRGEFGYTMAESRQHIPQDYLFRTGGTGSVRGYAYQSLGVKEGNAIVGGRHLAVASAEVTHWLDDAWGIAGFIDAGDAVDKWQDTRLALGYGFGARWRSPAGPIGADLAWGERNNSLQLHFSLAIPF